MGTDPGAKAGRVVAAVFFLSAATMAYEIVLIRLLSFRFWPHFVPLIVSQAMLGFGGAGVALQLFRRRAGRLPGRLFAWTVLLAAPSFDLAFRASQFVPFDPFLLLWDPLAWPRFGAFFFLLSVPFFLSGAATAIPFAFLKLRPGPVYAASFAGSAAGAFGALPFLALAPTGGLLRLSLALGAAACACVLADRGGGWRKGRWAVLCALLLLLILPPADLRLSPYKELAAVRKLPGAREIATRSGISGDFRAVTAPGIHSAPGLSIRFTGEIPPQAALFSDGEPAGVVPRDGGRKIPAYLGYFPSVLPYRLVERPRVLQIGLKGTEGVLTAAANGASSVTVVEPARELVRLVREDLSGFAGGWPRSLPVEVREEGARNFLARDRRIFDLIEAADISSATFSSLGVHATGETFFLTREGIRAAFSRLGEDGLLAFSGWLKVPPREIVKILRTIRAELAAAGHANAADRVVAIRGWGTFSLVARRKPFRPEEIDRAGRFCSEYGYSMIWPAGEAAAGDGAEDHALREAVSEALAGPAGARDAGLFDLSPVTDDSPYFHRFLRLETLPEFRRVLGSQWVPFVEWGIVFLVLSLGVSLLLAAMLLLLPAAFAGEGAGGASGISVAGYFSALGLAYMLVELTFLKAGILVLGDAIRAAGLAIGGFSFFSGIGSAVSGRWESGLSMKRVFAGIAVCVAAGFSLLSAAAGPLLESGWALRSAAFVGALAPAAFLMGIPFPAAISRLAAAGGSAIPFAWAVNGFFSVAGASLASIGAMWLGFRWTVGVGAVLYIMAGLLYRRVGRWSALLTSHGDAVPTGILPRREIQWCPCCSPVSLFLPIGRRTSFRRGGLRLERRFAMPRRLPRLPPRRSRKSGRSRWPSTMWEKGERSSSVSPPDKTSLLLNRCSGKQRGFAFPSEQRGALRAHEGSFLSAAFHKYGCIRGPLHPPRRSTRSLTVLASTPRSRRLAGCGASALSVRHRIYETQHLVMVVLIS